MDVSSSEGYLVLKGDFSYYCSKVKRADLMKVFFVKASEK